MRKFVAYQNDTERLIGETNPRMIYVDEQGHDFLLPRDEISPLRIEVMNTF